jgi:ABC-2 type transport system permease protein
MSGASPAASSTDAAPPPPRSGVINPHSTGTSLPHQVYVLAVRSIRAALARPATYMPSIVMPLMLLTINSSGLARVTDIPGFPADSFFDFALVTTFMQSALFATSSAGLGLAYDIETGFMDRLAMTPMRAGALVIAQIAGAMVIALGAACLYVTIGLVFGAEFAAGAPGVLALVGFALWTAFSFASVGAWMSLRAGSSEALQGVFPLLFATLFLSTVNMPRDLILSDWFRAITRVNPVSYMVDGMRSLIITGWDGSVLLQDAAVLTGISVLAVAGCAHALRQRLAHA